MSDPLEQRLFRLLAEAAPRAGRRIAVDRETHLRKDLGLDSIALVAAIFRFEREFGVVAGASDLDVQLGGLRTAGDVVDAARRVLEGVWPSAARGEP